MKSNIILSSLFFILAFPVFSQNIEAAALLQAQNQATAEMAERVMLARSSADYRVTPGDIYTLTFAVGATPVTFVITVDASYRISVANLGIVNGAGRTFAQVRNEVEAIVRNNIPLSGVQLTLTQPAAFRVFVNGEVHQAHEVSAWALVRLSSLIDDNLTAFASIRDVSVRSANGRTATFDLFRAQRLGDMSQDPFLRPGDVVTFNRINRSVTLSGDVERPGTYQLLDGENLRQLIEFYGNGFSPTADPTRMEIVRLVNSDDIAGNRILLTEADFENDLALEHFDHIFVPSLIQLQPVLFVEGAVVPAYAQQALGVTGAPAVQHDLTASNRLVVRFHVGETYASLVRRNIAWFTAVSDTESAYIIRDNRRIPVNLNPALFDASFRDELLVQENDVLVIPFRQQFVSVAGAVPRPGRFPLIPGRNWAYYIGLAGGFIPGLNVRNSVTIVDMNGNRLRRTDPITPETTITANTNSFLFHFNQVAPVITTLLSITATFLSVWAITNSN